jgi:Tfp pilus assembly protein PilF
MSGVFCNKHKLLNTRGSRLEKRTIGLRAEGFVAAGLLVLSLTACQTASDTAPAPAVVGLSDASVPVTSPTVEDPGDVKYYPSDEPLHLAIEHFNRGHYGIAEHYFQDAVEKAPKDVTAWIGLAASYDRLGRFDLADRAYHSAIRLEGETVQILNNEGYSYMLRGELNKARAKLAAAYRREPDNPTVINNLHLLDSSSRFVVRAPDAQPPQ